MGKMEKRKIKKGISMIIVVFVLLIIFSMIEEYYESTITQLEILKDCAQSLDKDIQREVRIRFEYLPNLETLLILGSQDDSDIVKQVKEARAQYNLAFANSDINGMVEADKTINEVIAKFREKYSQVAADEFYREFFDEYFGNELFDYRFRLCCCTHLCHEPAADACRLGVLCVHGGTQHGI